MRGKSPPAHHYLSKYILCISNEYPQLFSTAPLKNVSHHEMAMVMGFVGMRVARAYTCCSDRLGYKEKNNDHLKDTLG